MTLCIVDALTRLRLVNRANLGVQRMYKAMLLEGKEPPLIEEQGNSVRVTFIGGYISVPFVSFIQSEIERGLGFSIEQLLILKYLLTHPEIDTSTAARFIQRSDAQAREVLTEMEITRGYLERGGTTRGTYWSLLPRLHSALIADGHAERDHRIDWEAAKMRVFSILKQRAERGDDGLSNSKLRQITHLDRYQVWRLIKELEEEHWCIRTSGKGKGTKYYFDLDIK